MCFAPVNGVGSTREIGEAEIGLLELAVLQLGIDELRVLRRGATASEEGLDPKKIQILV